ncbi:MAG: hypothetical protein V5A45_07360 [Haloarculaceae archaeon]
MQPRDVFDGILLAILGTILYIRLIGPTFSSARVQTVVDVLLGLELIFYLVFAGMLAIFFLGYLFIYLPQKQSKNPTR